MKVALTGAHGFLGWHTRLRLHALTDHVVIPVGRAEWPELRTLLEDVDAVIHVAGVNRGSDVEVNEGNIDLAEDLAESLRLMGRPIRVVYANSIKAPQDNPYGIGKRTAGERLKDTADRLGGQFVDVRLPNLFGEHCRPHYNAFSATFIDHVIKGTEPSIADASVGLLHVQDAAQHLIDGLSTEADLIEPAVPTVELGEVWAIPDLSSKFRIDLFNTYRAALFPEHYPIRLVPHSDPRGSFVETVRCRGGEGQTSFSTTVPGITRGEHYHLHKIERFAVIRGQATMELRKMFTDEVLTFEVTGDEPVAVDMPVGWVHNIINTGDDILFTQFWSHELFRPDAPDTFPEPVRRRPSLEV